MSSGVTTSLSITFIVILGIGFALLNMSQNMSQNISEQLHHSFNLMPKTLVQ